MTEAQIEKLDTLADLISDILADEPTDEQIEAMGHPYTVNHEYWLIS